VADSVFLSDRGVIEVAGGDATSFLHKLITNSVLNIAAGESRYSGLLTPQGKLLFDFIVVPLPQGTEAGFYFDCLRDQAVDLAKRVNFHKMRAKVTITDRSEELGVAAFWGEAAPSDGELLVYRDMRAPGMGLRAIGPRASLAEIGAANEAAYEGHRVAQGVPKGGVDFVYGDTFVHDVNLDQLNGVDFKKGCYVGQEVVARVHFRNSARKRIVKVHFNGPTPEQGAQLMAGEIAIGQVGSIAGSEGLASLRLDKLEDAKAAGTVVKAGEALVEATVPAELIATAAGVEKRL
jgi:hypothetical protein